MPENRRNEIKMKICCVPVKKIDSKIVEKTDSYKVDYQSYIAEKDVCWIERSIAEKDNNYKQLIPYVLIKNSDGQFACYKRHGTEKRLHGLYSSGIGGHVDEPDESETLRQTLENGMFRELSEELTNFDTDKISLKYLGLINEKETEVGLVHLGIVFLAECTAGFLPRPASELSGMEWKTQTELATLKKELWSELAFKLLEE